MNREIVILPPTPENIDACRWMLGDKDMGVRIDSQCRARRTNHYKRVYRLRDGRYYINRHLGHWRQFVTGVRVIMKNGRPETYLGVTLTEIRPKRAIDELASLPDAQRFGGFFSGDRFTDLRVPIQARYGGGEMIIPAGTISRDTAARDPDFVEVKLSTIYEIKVSDIPEPGPDQTRTIRARIDDVQERYYRQFLGLDPIPPRWPEDVPVPRRPVPRR